MIHQIKKYRIPNTIYIILAFTLPLALYLKTLSPTYIPIDSAEFALCMRFWGLCHPPGFPLYILLGKVFTSFLPFGTLIYKANVFSAVFGALCVLLLYLILTELKVKREIAFFVSIFFAVSQILWEFSLAADVFTFGTFLILLAFYLAFRNLPILAFFALGLSASHFYLSAVLWPGFVWYFWQAYKSNRSYKSYRTYIARAPALLIWAGVFTLGFFPQALMFWRMGKNPEINWGHAQGINGFVGYVRRKEFGSIFLIANPVLTFTLLKFIKQIWVFIISFFASFAGVLPLLALVGAFVAGQFRDRKFLLLLSSFVIFALIQLFLLSTIDPMEPGSPFQLNKFYLSAFAIWAILTGYGLNALAKRFFDELSYLMILFVFITLIYFFANFKVNNYRDNYFSQNMVLDAYSQLPPNSIAIVVSHIAYFGGLYEQKINGKFPSVKILYFPNEKNRDSQKYHSELFSKKGNQTFEANIRKANNLGNSENYILGVISKNLDSPVFILQGGFEEKYFSYLKLYLRPYGLWWQVVEDLQIEQEIAIVEAKLQGLKNDGVKNKDLELKQQKDDVLTYAIAYHTAGVYLGSLGEYDKALGLLKKSLEVNTDAKNVQDEIDLVAKTVDFAKRADELFSKGDEVRLLEFGNNLFTLANYKDCEQVFLKMTGPFAKDAQVWNNLGSCRARQGKVETARSAYQKALELDPKLDLARQGLESLEK